MVHTSYFCKAVKRKCCILFKEKLIIVSALLRICDVFACHLVWSEWIVTGVDE